MKTYISRAESLEHSVSIKFALTKKVEIRKKSLNVVYKSPWRSLLKVIGYFC